MRLVTKEGIERLLLANPIAELAAERGIHLEPLGSELLVGRCPRHEDTAGRSLLVERTSGRFRCLACPLYGGNVIGFVIQVDRVPFMAALERLSLRAGLDLDELMGEASPARPRRRAVRSVVPAWALTPAPFALR
jgi:DNA primase